MLDIIQMLHKIELGVVETGVDVATGTILAVKILMKLILHD